MASLPTGRNRNLDLIYYDLETTGFSAPHITQIAAIDSRGREWSTYVLPKKRISKRATGISGLTMTDGQLYRDGEVLPSVGIREAIPEFIDFIKNRRKPAVLVGHNSTRFDNRILLRAARDVGMETELRGSVSHCIDIMVMFRQIYPDRESYSLKNLVKDYLECDYDAHNAIADAEVLKRLVKHKFSPQQLGQQLAPFGN